MTSSFADLKRGAGANLDRLTNELEKLNKPQAGNSGPDDRFWKITEDKVGNGYAVIRFLPAPPKEDLPFVHMWSHAFQGQGGWYIENCLSTLGNPDPVMEMNSQLWNSGIDANKDLARKQKRQLAYYSNIYVVKDSAKPENEGKVFLFKYGKKIFDMINDLMSPQFEDEKPVNPFDFWAGADFKLKIRKVEGYRNYDKSEFSSPAPLTDDDDRLEQIWQSQYSLQDIVSPKNFKSYDELKARLDKALGLATVSTQERAFKAPDETPPPAFKAAAAPQQSVVDDDDEDIGMEFFKSLAEED